MCVCVCLSVLVSQPSAMVPWKRLPKDFLRGKSPGKESHLFILSGHLLVRMLACVFLCVFVLPHANMASGNGTHVNCLCIYVSHSFLCGEDYHCPAGKNGCMYDVCVCQWHPSMLLYIV